MARLSDERIQAYDDFAEAYDDGFDYYPDKGAVSAYVRETRTHLPLQGILVEVFRDTNVFRKQYPDMPPQERCSSIIAKWNEKHPHDVVEDPFA